MMQEQDDTETRRCINRMMQKQDDDKQDDAEKDDAEMS
jgi:hypothetical protein